MKKNQAIKMNTKEVEEQKQVKNVLNFKNFIIIEY